MRLKPPPDDFLYRDDYMRACTDSYAAFIAASPDGVPLLQDYTESLVHLVLSIQRDCKINNLTRDLMASFVRTAMISAGMVSRSELIEVVTLNRKQIELIARLRELDTKAADELIGKVPKVSALRSRVKELYGSMSRSAHSADYGHLALLGFYKDQERNAHVLYPEFTKNTLVVFDNWCMVVNEFILWGLDFRRRELPHHSTETEERKFLDLHRRKKKAQSLLAGHPNERH